MLKVKSGDIEKLGLLYRRYGRRLFGFFYRMTGSVATGEDLVQNVFERILKYKHTYMHNGHFESWIFHVARNVHRDYLKKNSRYQFQENMDPWEAHLKEEDTREREIQRDDEIRNLARVLRTLPGEKRELIELTKFQKMKYEQVAMLLGISESAVKVRVHRILKELKASYLKLDA